jgi:hypothetical protein
VPPAIYPMDVCGHRELQSLLLEWFGSVGDKVLAPKIGKSFLTLPLPSGVRSAVRFLRDSF